MKTTEIKTIEKSVILQVTNKVTTTSEDVVIVLPRSIFRLRINKGDEPTEYKRFLVLEYQGRWIDRASLTKEIVNKINNYLGADFIKPCSNCSYGYISLHYNDNPNKQICKKIDGDNYIIFTKCITTEIKTEHKKLF